MELFRPLKNQDGSLLVLVLMMLAIATIVGINASRNTMFEKKITANEQIHQIAFYAAEGGSNTLAKIVSRCVDNSTEPSGGYNTTFLSYDASDSTDDLKRARFYRQLMGFEAHDNSTDAVIEYEANINSKAEIDVERVGTNHLPGCGVEFASGSSGVGAGSTGGVGIYYNITSTGRGGRNAKSVIDTCYRKIVGTAGGL